MAIIITTKESVLIQDLLSAEENACKKARLYSRILTNKDLAESFIKLAENHEKRFLNLLEIV